MSKVLLLNQCFHPDVASTGQHATDLARELVKRGHEITVLASRRGYDDPTVRLPKTEWWDGIRIYRVRCTGFGKAARWRRAADFATFYVACLAKLVRIARFDVVVAMTTPPLISFLAALFVRLKGGDLHLWVMDLNPDQALAAGWLREGSAVARVLDKCLRYALRQAASVVVLDRFMKERLMEKGVTGERMLVLPPWSHDGVVRYDDEGRQAFRERHGLTNKFVVMYSGNHSPCHPLDTLLGAVARLAGRGDIVFCFVGGGSEFGKVRRLATEQRLNNVVCLPYQTLEQVSASLSAADLHVVVMGEPFVGIVHPCKIYNILRLGIPLLYIGPSKSHVTDMLPTEATGSWARLALHGEVETVVRHVLESRQAGMKRRFPAEVTVAERFSQDRLAGAMAELVQTSGVH